MEIDSRNIGELVEDFRQRYLEKPEFLKFCLTYCEKEIDYSKRKGQEYTLDLLSPFFYSRDFKKLPNDELEHMLIMFDHHKNPYYQPEEYPSEYGLRNVNYSREDEIIAKEFKDDLLKKFYDYRKILYSNYCKLDELGNVSPVRDYFGFKVFRNHGDKLIEMVRSGVGFEKDFPYFFRTVILKTKFEIEPFLEEYRCYAKVYNPKNKWGLDASFIDFLRALWNEIVVPDIDQTKSVNNKMSGSDYEEYCANILSNAGWKVSITKASNDQGVDIIAEIENLKFCIQCKRYSNPVSNKAVQEVYAGKDFYRGTHAVVVSNAGFTKSARDLAKSSGVILISDIELEKLKSYQ